MAEDPSRRNFFIHDMKNQLGIIIGFVDLVIEDTPPADPRLESLYEIRAAAQACLKLLNDVPPDSTEPR